MNPVCDKCKASDSPLIHLPNKSKTQCLKCLEHGRDEEINPTEHYQSEKYEKINHPDHYQSDKFEVIDITEAFKLDFSLGSVVKYVLRAGKKPKESMLEDLSKALWFLQDRIERISSNEEEEK
jgi:hypothetical protein